MINIKKGNTEDKGVWFDCAAHEVHQAIINCPMCDGAISLKGYTIFDDGKVFPSVTCPHGLFMWHKYLALLEWKKPEQ